MCRLFGMSGGDRRMRATFWLLEAPDSLARQSRREPDGTGVGCDLAFGGPGPGSAEVVPREGITSSAEAMNSLIVGLGRV